jgi:hypothetical protein
MEIYMRGGGGGCMCILANRTHNLEVAMQNCIFIKLQEALAG